MTRKLKYSEYINKFDIYEIKSSYTKIEYKDTDYIAIILENLKRQKIEIFRCPGCFPFFIYNQLGHIGPNGCLGDYCDSIFLL